MQRFETLLASWAQWFQHTRNKSPATLAKYEAYLLRFSRWVRGEDPAAAKPTTTDPCAVTQQDVELYVGLHAHARGLKPQSRLGELASLRSFYGWAAARGLLPGNPACDVSYPSVGRPLPRPISMSWAEKVLMAPGISEFTGLRDTTMIAVLISTGVRVSGLLGLTERSLMWFNDGPRERLALRVLEKGKAERVVTASREVAVLMRAYMGHETYRSTLRDLKGGDRVLWMTTGRRCPPHLYHGPLRQMSVRTFQERLEFYGEQVGVPPGLRSPHAYRHLMGTELAESDVDVLQRQVILGHVSADTTRIYSHLATRKIMATIDQASPIAKMRGDLVMSLRALQAAAAPTPKP